MIAKRLDGVAMAALIRADLQPRVDAFVTRHGRPPALSVVLAGSRADSEVYVRHKLKAVAESGCRADLVRLPESASLDEVLAAVDRLNRDEGVDGILVQSPLPSAMGRHAEQRVFDAVDPRKDVDGYHPENVGRLAQNRASLVPCTPLGCIELLEREGIPIAGRRAVVIGRSGIVGRPMAQLLVNRDATVTICHSKTMDLPALAREADILVAAIGRAGFVTADFVKPGATVIDVGINVLTSESGVTRMFAPDSAKRRAFAKNGSVLAGDVHPDVEHVAGALTPVPGGVGPLTVAMVLRNTITAAESRLG